MGVSTDGAPPILLVFKSVVGSGLNVEVVCRDPPELAFDERTWLLGVVAKTSLPSRKKRRFSGKNVSKAVRFTTTSSDSTAPKSGFNVAVSCRLEVGRQETSIPALPSFS
tara:strand:- start:8 stop:337 length:330 start_codon:yes stop_codon:yes gene_type:complete